MSILTLVITFLGSLLKSQRQLRLENLALRQQVAMLQQSVKRARVSKVDKGFWILFSRYVDGWRNTLHALHPDTVVRWHRQGFRLYWRWKSRGPRPGRPPIDKALRKLIREMQATNLGWGAPYYRAPESTVNYSSWVLRYLKQRFLNICCIRKSHLHKHGGLFSTTTQIVCQQWISLRSPPPHFVFSTCSSCSAMTVGKSSISTRQSTPLLGGQRSS
jgi:hypothetical protein